MILCLFYITNKFFTPTDLLDSATTDFGFKQTKTEPQSPRSRYILLLRAWFVAGLEFAGAEGKWTAKGRKKDRNSTEE